MNLYGFFNAATGAWLDNDFQSPHFVDIAARHCGTDHKTVGNWRRRLAEQWQKREISLEEIMAIFAGGN